MKTLFFRVIDAPVESKGELLKALICTHESNIQGVRRVFCVDTEAIHRVPAAPFAYWASEALISAFHRLPRYENDQRTALQGASTCDDFRYVRFWVEVRPALKSTGPRWVGFAKGGRFARFYADVPAVVRWDEMRLSFHGFVGRPGRWNPKPVSADHYLKPAVTWPLRGMVFSAQALPADCAFSVGGKVALAPIDELPLCLGVFNSVPFHAAISLFAGKAGGFQYETGVINAAPFPLPDREVKRRIVDLSRDGWRTRRELDTRNETSHAFVLPVLLVRGNDLSATLAERARTASCSASAARDAVQVLESELNEICAGLYGVSLSDLETVSPLEASSEAENESAPESESDDESDEEVSVEEDIDTAPMVASLLSWSIGVAFGRFDVRRATGERAAPTEPGPFDPLPVCSPGMLTGDDGLPLATPPTGYPLIFPTDGVLVDDPGHPRDLVRAVRSVFDTVFDDANGRWHEAAELLGTPDLRTWFTRDFFEPHVKRYSKSRRKAPIYWQLATASGSYSVWIYIHRATSDTLFRILESDFLGGKLDHEKAKLDGLIQEAGPNPSAAKRSEIEQQENFVGELSALKTEIVRVAPLWNPDLDDGVILNFAPLWRLVPQSRSWQGECKKAWDKLVSGDYDWAHLAMHLWPERVVPKCIDDRSLAIAHGLEDVFWHEDASGTWCKSQVDETTIQKLIAGRTSTTVKAALKDLLSAATPTASKGRKAKGRSASPRSAAPKPLPAAALATAAEATVDEATLSAVKAAIASVADGVSKADVLAATGLSDADWNRAIAALLVRGDVTRIGEKRGTRYHADAQGEDG